MVEEDNKTNYSHIQKCQSCPELSHCQGSFDETHFPVHSWPRRNSDPQGNLLENQFGGYFSWEFREPLPLHSSTALDGPLEDGESETEQNCIESSSELPTISEDVDDAESFEESKQPSFPLSISVPGRLSGEANEESPGDSSLDMSSQQDDDYAKEWSALIRNKRGRSAAEEDEVYNDIIKTRCKSHLGDLSTADIAAIQPFSGSLDRTMSHSTPSIESAGQLVQKDTVPCTESTGEKSRHPTEGKIKKSSTSSSGSHVPPWAMMTARPMTIATTTKSGKANRSYSTAAAIEHEVKEKNIKRSGSSFLFRVGIMRNSSRHKQDKHHRSSKSHLFVSPSISEGGVCEVCRKSLAKFYTPALQCDKCDIFVHESCKKEAGHCVKWTKHPRQQLKARTDVATAAQSAASRNEEKGESEICSGHNDGFYSGLALHDESIESDAEEDVPSLRPDRSFPPLISPEWQDLGLWQVEPEAWSIAYKQNAKKLPKKEVKRQDVIHELYITEKHHCETLIMLKQTYRKMLEEKQLISCCELDSLVPNVVDELLEFHSNFLRQLQQKREEIQVTSVQDVIVKQFSGKEAGNAIEAYVHFCSSKRKANELYRDLSDRNTKFRLVMEHISRYALYKDRTLPDCLLLVTQRLTKYPVLIGEICKNTEGADVDGMRSAVTAVKNFTAKVDSGVQKVELKRQWDEIREKMEVSSSSTFHDVPFTAENLIGEERELLSMGNVQWQNAARKPAAVRMLLFRDIIVFLQTNGSKFWFFSQDKHEAVLSVSKLLVRERAGKPGGIFLISTGKKLDMYEIVCHSKNDLHRWLRVLEYAVKNCPESERMYASGDREATDKLAALKTEISQLFDEKLKLDEKLRDYFDSQVDWYKVAKGKLHNLCIGSNRDIRNRVIDFISEEFDKISLQRSIYVSDYINTCEELLRGSIFEVVAEDGSSKPENSSNTPKRVFTFNAPGDINVNGKPKTAVRRHTTVPKIRPNFSVMEEDTPDAWVREERCKTVLGSEEVVAKWIKELSSLKLENERLEKELSMRRAEVVLSHSENQHHLSLEKLRQAQTELQNNQRNFELERSGKIKDLEDKVAALNERQVFLDRREEEIENKWNAFYKQLHKHFPGLSENSDDGMGNSSSFALQSSASCSVLEKRSTPLPSHPDKHQLPHSMEGKLGMNNSESCQSSGNLTAAAHKQQPEQINLLYSLLNQPKDGGLPKQQIPKNLLSPDDSSKPKRRGSASPGRKSLTSHSRIGSLFGLQEQSQVLPQKLAETHKRESARKKKK